MNRLRNRALLITLLLITSILSLAAKDSGECFVILIEQSDAVEQTYQFYDTFSSNIVKELWNNNRHLSAVKHTKAGYLVISEAKRAGSKQGYIYSDFKDVQKTCEADAKNGEFVTSISFGNLEGTRWYWWALSNIMPHTTKQVVEMVSVKSLNKWAEKQAALGLKITQCARKFGECAVVAQDGTDIDKQLACSYDNVDAAMTDVQQKWKEGWRVGIIDVSTTNKYLIIYNTYTKPREGEQYLAYCDSREGAIDFIKKRTNKSYHITQVGGSYYEGPKDENGNKQSFTEIIGGLLTKTAQLYTDIKGGQNSSEVAVGDDGNEGTFTGSNRTQQDYQKEYDHWVDRAKRVSLKWFKHGKIDSQNYKQGVITAGDRQQLLNYQKLMRGVVTAAQKRGFTIKRNKMETFVP